MGRRKHKTHNNNKKGPTAPLGLAGPPGNPEQEAEGQRNLPVITQENTSSSSPPSSPSSLPSEASSHSLSKECDTTSTTEDTSFASCLTGNFSSASEVSPLSPVRDLIPSSGITKKSEGEVFIAESSNNSDSEYESAEELNLPPDRAPIVEVQPTSNILISPSTVTDQTQSTQQEVSVPLAALEKPNDLPVHEECPLTKTEVVPVAVESPVVSTESTPVTVDKESENLTSTICDSLVTITKREIIEESVSKNTVPIVEQVTEPKPESELNEVITPSSSAQSLESNVILTPEKSIPNSTESGNRALESGSCKTLISESHEILIERETKVSEDQLHAHQDILVSKDKEDGSHSESQLSGESTNIVDRHDGDIIQQSDSQVISEKNESDIQNCSNHIVETVELPKKLEENNKTKDTKDISVPKDRPALNSNSFEEPREEQQTPSEKVIDPDDIPIVPKQSYNLDFLESLDDPTFNPFATKTSIRSSPPPSPEPGCKLPPLKPAVRKKKVIGKDKQAQILAAAECDTKTQVINGGEDQTVKEKQVELNHLGSSLGDSRLPVPEVTPVDESTTYAPEVQSDRIEHSEKSEQLLEITFDEPVNSVSRPPRKLGKKPQLKQQRQPIKKVHPKTNIVEKNNNRVEDKVVTESETKPEHEEDLPIPPSKGYNLDFLDNLDDENFNPFATKCSVSNSPPKEGFTLPNETDADTPKPKSVPAKKAPAKKGFTVIKNKAKTKVPAVDEVDSPKEKVDTVDSSKEKVDTVDVDAVVNHSENNSLKSPEEKEDIPIKPKGGYNLDFLDDPSFDPFQTRIALDKNTLNVAESDTSKHVPKDVDVAKDNSVNEEVEPGVECGKVSVTDSSKQSDSNKEQLSQTPQEEVKDEPGLIIEKADKEETRETEPLVEKKEEPKVVEETAEVENKSNQVSVGEPQGGEEKPQTPTGGIPKVTDSLSEFTKEKFESDEVHLKLKGNSQISEEVRQALQDLKPESKLNTETEGSFSKSSNKEISDTNKEINLPKVPSIGTIGQLDSLEFAQLLGNEASRLAEEFMNCSTDSGLPDSDDNSCIKANNIESAMGDTSCNKSPQYGAHLDENVNPLQKQSRLSRSPPLGKREAVCGAESGDSVSVHDPMKARRSLKRESVMGEERLDTVSVDDDSGIVLGTRSDLETEVNHSEAGPEIATGLTSSDLRCASQFFKEATDMENQIRKTLTSPLMGSHSKLSGDEVMPIRDRKELPVGTPESPQNKPAPSTSSPAPPHEERSAPEGTSSPTPRPSDTSEQKPSSSRPASVPPEGYMTAAEVQELLKHQELKFEEKLLQVELAAGEKEKKLRQTMKDEQKELTNLGESMAELTQSRDALLKMVGQYKGMLAQLVSEKEKEKQNAEERIKALEAERNQALEDLANVEVAFSDVHRKYERIKQVIDTLKRNEETLRGAVTDYENKLQKQEQKFVEFQKHAEEKIQLANEEFKTMRKANDQEMTKMAALLKKAEMKIMSLQDAFDRKTRENQELTQLCDDLINKVGTSS